MIFGTTKGLFSSIKKNIITDSSKFICLIREFKLKNDSLIFGGTFFNSAKNSKLNFATTQSEKNIPIFTYDNNSFTVNYSSTYYEFPEKVLYSYKLDGFDNEWSDWTSETKKDYTNLYEGKYNFMVRAKNYKGEISNTASFKFIIKPPIHRTILAYFIFLVLLILIIAIVVKLYTKRLVKAKEKLEQVVLERTSEIRQQKEEIQTQAEELEAINEELQKLSIVASKTDNAVIIFNSNLNLIWTNDAFIKIYGYTHHEIIKSDEKINIINFSTRDDIKQIIEKCITEKISVSYEAQNKTKSGKDIWVQSTLTPIFENDKLSKIIAIESEITKLKTAQIEINQQNIFIKSSINYAKTIQNAILPLSENLSKCFDNFILFKPKDIVSGDFYWHLKTKNAQFFAVVDCTGHGVPGAFMSMIGYTLLNDIVNRLNVTETDKILLMLNEEVVKSLKQDVTDVKDGMDLIFCRITKHKENNFKINYSGAKRPFYYFSNLENKLFKLNGDRRSIGGDQHYSSKITFTNNELILRKNDLIYLTSDGFIDQNNAKRKRFGSMNFEKIISENANLELNIQKEILEKELKNWQQDERQRDDITIWGIRL